jgi:pilus assembly protein CpaC
MYDNSFANTRFSRPALFFAACSMLAIGLTLACCGKAAAQAVYDPTSVIRKISERSEKLELTTNTSRILTMDKKIPRVQVNNPELVAVTPLSDKDVQISAKKAGVTQVNLWDIDGNIHTVDVMIYGDARELANALQTQFPHSSIKVYRYSESLVLTGFVDRPDHVGPIMRLAEDYAPKVINNINVGGVQQILLKIKVMEISRTKLRRMATDVTWLDANGGFFSTGVSGLLNQTTNISGGFQSVADTAGKAAEFGIVGDNGAFFGFIDWLQQNNVAKILSEPNIMAVSGRPAQFNVGGEIPVVVPQSLGTASIEFKPFGTQIDFLPIVLGNGNIRLEVRPRVSEIDDSRSVIIQDFVIPALTVRQVDTAVEMKAGQTFALAGLVQERTESLKRGLPYVSDMPVIGLPFRRVEDEVNEIELLILVTPEFVDPIDACEAPCDGPGYFTTSPTNRGLYCGAQMEVPAHCNPIQGLTTCGQDPCASCARGNCNGGGCNNCNGGMMEGHMPVITDGVTMPGGVGYDDSGEPATITDQGESVVAPGTATPNDLPLPPQSSEESQPLEPAVTPPAQDGTFYPAGASNFSSRQSAAAGQSAHTASRPHNPPRQPVFLRNPYRPHNPPPAAAPQATAPSENGLIGPIGYDNQ